MVLSFAFGPLWAYLCFWISDLVPSGNGWIMSFTYWNKQLCWELSNEVPQTSWSSLSLHLFQTPRTFWPVLAGFPQFLSKVSAPTSPQRVPPRHWEGLIPRMNVAGERCSVAPWAHGQGGCQGCNNPSSPICVSILIFGNGRQGCYQNYQKQLQKLTLLGLFKLHNDRQKWGVLTGKYRVFHLSANIYWTTTIFEPDTTLGLLLQC